MANTVIDYKTVRMDLLTDGGWVLDGGCMGWGFAAEMASRRMRVLAVDPSIGLKPPNYAGLTFENVALVGIERDTIGYVSQHESQENYTDDVKGRRVKARTIGQLMTTHNIALFDVVKMNVEGAEYEILSNWPGPVASQITVSFHEFIPGRNPDPDGYFDAMFAHLDKWYRVEQHEWTVKGETEGNYWDSLFILRT